MNLTSDNVKKISLVISKAFDIAFKLRAKIETQLDKTRDYSEHDIAFSVCVHTGLEGVHYEKVSNFQTMLLEHHDWDLNKFFEVAANPQLMMHNGMDTIEYQGGIKKMFEDDVKTYMLFKRSQKDIQKDAQKAMIELQEYANSL